MEYTFIPNLGKKVCRVGLGTWAIGGWLWGGTDEKESILTLHRAFDLGINLIDTAPVYGFGLSEELVGKALKSYRNKNKLVIATKVGLNWQNRRPFCDASKKRIKEEIELSLKRLGVEQIGVYQIHWPDPQTPIDETAEAMLQLLNEGKIGAIGVCNFTKKMMEEFQNYAPCHTLQSPYNLFERGIEKLELPYCQKHKIPVMGYSPICRGLLSGRMHLDVQFQGDDLRLQDPKFQLPRFSQYLSCVRKLNKWAEEKYQKSVLLLAIRWVLDQGVAIPLWGARHPQQLDPIEQIWDWKLNSSDMKEIDEIISQTVIDPVGPEFMAPPLRPAALKTNS